MLFRSFTIIHPPTQEIHHYTFFVDMLDIVDFIEERGGDPERIRESQGRRGDSIELVDEIIEMWHANRKGKEVYS